MTDNTERREIKLERRDRCPFCGHSKAGSTLLSARLQEAQDVAVALAKSGNAELTKLCASGLHPWLEKAVGYHRVDEGIEK